MKIKKTRSSHKSIFADRRINRLEKQLAQYSIPPVLPQQIDRIVEDLRQYVPKKQGLWHKKAERLAGLLRTARQDMPFINRGYWLACLAIFGIGCWMTAAAQVSEHTIMLLLAPIPFILGLLELFKGRDFGMAEMEMTCKYSIREVILARVVVIGAYSILLNTLLSVFIFYLRPGSFLGQLTLFWLTPFTSISAIALYAVQKVRSRYAVAFLLAVWAAAVPIIQMTGYAVILQTFNTTAYLLITFVSAISLICEARKATDKYFLTNHRKAGSLWI